MEGPFSEMLEETLEELYYKGKHMGFGMCWFQ